jgi:hypothetical protein
MCDDRGYWIGPHLQKGSTMAQAKRALKRKRRSIALPALGAAGASLMMANGASSATAPTATSLQDTLVRPVITLNEEEIADVSLGTFYVFDKENESQLGQGIRLAARCGGCGRCGGRCAAARCGGAARCAVARCAGRCGCAARCGGCGGCGGGGWFIACAGCVSIGCGGGCWRWTAAGWVWVC